MSTTSATTTITVPASVANRLMTWLGSPAAAELERESADKVFQQRKADVAERLSIEAKRTELQKKFAPKEAAALKRLEEARAAVTAATDAVLQVRRDYYSVDYPLGRQFDRLTHKLEQTPHQAIVDFREEMRAEMNATQAMGHFTEEPGFTGYPIRTTNFPSVNRRIEAISNSRDAVNALTLRALSDAELAKEMQAIRDSWPAIEFEKVR